MINSLFTEPTELVVVIHNTAEIKSSLDEIVVGVDDQGSELKIISKCSDLAKNFLYEIMSQSNDPNFLDDLNLNNLLVSNKIFRIMNPNNLFDSQIEYHIDTKKAYIKNVSNDRATYKLLNGDLSNIEEKFFYDIDNFNKMFGTSFTSGISFSAILRPNPIYLSYEDLLKNESIPNEN
jgi:hypothetical protein